MMVNRCWAVLVVVVVSCAACAGREGARPAEAGGTTRPAAAATEPNVLQSLHVRVVVEPADGGVSYLGWYDGRRNLLGPSGIVAAIVGMQPPELNGELVRTGPNELRFAGIDQNRIGWVKTYRLDENTVHVSYQVTNLRGQEFAAIVYSLADLPDAVIKGDNRDMHVETPTMRAHFRARIDDPHFPGEQMNPFAMRSASRELGPGESMEFRMTWELILPGR